MIGNTGTFSHASDQSPDMTKVTGMRIYPNRAKLIRVKDRGVVYDPPTEHLGSTIDDVSPIVVAGLMLEYIAAMVHEAEALISD